MKFTKDEIAGVLLTKLQPTSDDVLADIGCGSGRISAFFSPYVRKVYAVENDAKAAQGAAQYLSAYPNVEVLHMDGREFVSQHSYDLAFFGGTQGISEMLEHAVSRARRVVVNAARLEVASSVITHMRRLGVFSEALIVNISKSYDLAEGTAFKNLNPVFMVVACCSE